MRAISPAWHGQVVMRHKNKKHNFRSVIRVRVGRGGLRGRGSGVIMVLNSTDLKGRDSTCSPCLAPLSCAAGPPLSGAVPSQPQSGLNTVCHGTVDSLIAVILMSQRKALTDRNLGQRLCSPECVLEELVYGGPDLPGTKQSSNFIARIERAGGTAGECQANL